MFIGPTECLDAFEGERGIDVLWDDGAGHLILSVRLGRPAAPPEEVATAISEMNTELGQVAFRLRDDHVVVSLAAFLDPEGRISTTVLKRLREALREALGRFVGPAA